MRTSLIINTCALDPYVQAQGNPYRATRYGDRAKALEEKIIPSGRGFDEVLVVGCYKPYTPEHNCQEFVYIPMAPRWRDRRDALWQRDLGARYATGDILVFCHDDHALSEGFAHALMSKSMAEPWDILVPKRVHGVTGAELDNGKASNYMGGHACIFRRWIWAEVPFSTVSIEFWDVSLTRLWREAGAKIVWTDELTHIDVEAGEGEL